MRGKGFSLLKVGNVEPKVRRMTIPRIKCRVTFLTPDKGGRARPFPKGALSGNQYRPHVVVGDPTLLDPGVDQNTLLEDYIGIAFEHGPEIAPSGVALEAILSLIYFPHPVYDVLTPGADFTIREGRQLVGFGTVLSWLD